MKKVLIVDDSTFMRNVIKDLLSNKIDDVGVMDELKFSEADGKTKAIQQVKKIKPDTILLDIVMKESELEGVEFLEEINPYFDIKKIIMISSIGQSDVIEKCKKMGLLYYIQKPIDHKQLIEAVNQVIK